MQNGYLFADSFTLGMNWEDFDLLTIQLLDKMGAPLHYWVMFMLRKKKLRCAIVQFYHLP